MSANQYAIDRMSNLRSCAMQAFRDCNGTKGKVRAGFLRYAKWCMEERRYYLRVLAYQSEVRK